MDAARAAINAVRDRLHDAGNASARAEADQLAAHVLGVARSRLVLADTLSEQQSLQLQGLLVRRLAGVPLQHLLGSAPFRHLELAVGPGVFIPRPETELLLDIASPALRAAALVIDLCSGSGAVALAVANEYPDARVIAVERSPAALQWLRRNADSRAAAGDRPIEVVQGDVADPDLLADYRASADVVLANPPYVADTLRGRLPKEVEHDPDRAVFAGADGLALMAPLCAMAARLLRPGALVVIERDETHTADLGGALRGWNDIMQHRDLTGRMRFSSAIRAE